MRVSSIGMGCMGFTHAYGRGVSQEEGRHLVHKAFDLGCTFFDTAEMYSYLKNEEFLGQALEGLPRDKVIISDKFWPTPLPGQEEITEKLSETGIRKCLASSMKRLKTDYIDLYTLHMMDENHLEQVAVIMGKLIREGKIRGWGLSSPSAEQIIIANDITPVTAVQSEYSMMERKWEKEVIPLCGKLGIGFAAFAPMGNGFLSGKYSSSDTFQQNDLRSVITRFNKENMDANQPLLDLIHVYAGQKQCTAAQIALAWILKGNDFIVPIPGMRKEERIIENLSAADVTLSDEEYDNLNAELNRLKIYGDRNGKDIARLASVPDNVS